METNNIYKGWKWTKLNLKPIGHIFNQNYLFEKDNIAVVIPFQTNYSTPIYSDQIMIEYIIDYKMNTNEYYEQTH